jgi:hypothetical protein
MMPSIGSTAPDPSVISNIPTTPFDLPVRQFGRRRNGAIRFRSATRA